MGGERRTPYGLVIGFVVGILTAGLMVPFVRAEETTTTQRAGEAGTAQLDRQPGSASPAGSASGDTGPAGT
ncbi:MAG TPA: hypothetical protein VIR58_12620, partial [Acidimicrobiales bacterium]